MKKGEIELKFSNETIDFLGNEILFNTTSSGLHHLPLMINMNNDDKYDHIVLCTTENKSHEDIVLRLIDHLRILQQKNS